MRTRNVAVINDNDTISIYIGKKQWATIDTVDLPKVAKHKWSALPAGRKGYYAKATIRIGEKVTTLLMHHLIKPKRNGREVDHIDRNKINNTRGNLRLVTHQENLRNQGQRSGTKSGKTGVYVCGKTGAFKASVSVSGKRLHLGTFRTLKDAVNARKIGEKKYYGSKIV
jgi:hypothetical protein